MEKEIDKKIEKEMKDQSKEPYYDEATKKWKNYHPQKNVIPPWNPFNKERKKSMTIRERKFLMVLSTTGKLQDAYRAAYTIKPNPDKKLESARITAIANQVLTRLRKKFPELVEAMLFEDITPDFVRKEMMKLYKNDVATIGERTRILELMGKIHGMFTDKQVVESSIKQIVGDVYRETDEDFEVKDNRLSRLDIENINIGKA